MKKQTQTKSGKGSNGPPEAFIARKVDDYTSICLEYFRKHHGDKEMPLWLFGIVKGTGLFVLNALIPTAQVSGAYFTIDSKTLSREISSAIKSGRIAKALNLIALFHTHPSDLPPVPSHTDDHNLFDVASCYNYMNLQKGPANKRSLTCKREDDSGLFRLDVNRLKTVFFSGNEPEIIIENRKEYALFGSIIYSANKSQHTADVVEHVFSADDPEPKVIHHTEVPLTVMSDEEILNLSGSDASALIDIYSPQEIEREIQQKYTPISYSWTSEKKNNYAPQSPTHYDPYGYADYLSPYHNSYSYPYHREEMSLDQIADLLKSAQEQVMQEAEREAGQRGGGPIRLSSILVKLEDIVGLLRAQRIH